MKTHVADTSLSTYADYKVRFGAQELDVLAYMERVGADVTINEVAQQLGIPASTISGRLNDLRHKDVITDASPKRRCKVCGRTCKTWRMVTPDDRLQRSLFERRTA